MCASRGRWSGPGRPSRAARHNYHRVTQSQRKTEKSTTSTLSICHSCTVSQAVSCRPRVKLEPGRGRLAPRPRNTPSSGSGTAATTLLTTSRTVGPFPTVESRGTTRRLTLANDHLLSSKVHSQKQKQKQSQTRRETNGKLCNIRPTRKRTQPGCTLVYINITLS